MSQWCPSQPQLQHWGFTTSNAASSIFTELREKFSDTKLKSASTRLLSHLDGYPIKRSRCARPVPGSVERDPVLILPLMWYVTLAGHFSLWSFFLYSTVKLLDLKVSKRFTSSDILGFMYSRLNHIKLLCLWAKNSWISAGEYFTSYKPQARTFHCLVWFLFKKSPWGSLKGPIETYIFMYSKNLKDYFDNSFLWEGLWVMLPFYFKILCTIRGLMHEDLCKNWPSFHWLLTPPSLWPRAAFPPSHAAQRPGVAGVVWNAPGCTVPVYAN